MLSLTELLASTFGHAPRAGDCGRRLPGDRSSEAREGTTHWRRAAVCFEWCVLAVLFTIFVGCGGHSAAHTPSLVSLQIQSPTSSVLLGSSEQLTVLGKFDDGSSQNLTASVTWSSANPLVALVGDNDGRKGFLTGIGSGSTTIIAMSGAITAKSGIAVTIPTPRFAYLMTFGIQSLAKAIGAYTVDNTGNLSPVPGPPVPVTGAASGSMSASPDGNFLYAPCSSTFSGVDAICTFKIDRNSGALQAAGATPPLTQTVVSTAVSPSGHFLYAGLTGCPIVVFSIDAGTGALTQVQSVPVVTGQCIEIVIDPAEQFLYSADPGSSGAIAGFNIDQKTGMLTSLPGSPFQAPIDVGTSFGNLTMDVAGRSVYYDFAFTVSNLELDGRTGALTFLSSAANSTKFPCQIAKTGRFLYVPDCFFGGINQFSIDPSTGKIAAQNVFSDLQAPGPANVDPSGKFLYVLNVLQIDIYSIDNKTGALNLSSTIAVGGDPNVTRLTQLIMID